jgi:hypothetical protein
MASTGEFATQREKEIEGRRRLGVPAFGGGFLYLLGAIILVSVSNNAPTVGLLQAIAPAFSGVGNPRVSPRTLELKYDSHHAYGLIAGGVFTAIALVVLTLVLLLLADATRFRRPQSLRTARLLVLIGGVVLSVDTVVREIAAAITEHNFAVGLDHSNNAVEHMVNKSAAVLTFGTIGPVAWLVLVAGMFPTLINAMRVGLLPRWMSFLGMFAAVLIVLGGAVLEVIPAFWMVGMGVLLIGRWPNGDPPAWAAGEAVPWPSAASMRAARQGGTPAPAGAGADVAPAPSRASVGSSRKRRRKRSSRG